MTKVFLWPGLSAAPKGSGIGRIIHAQHRYLPALGVELVSDPRKAEVFACHTQRGDAPRVDISHCHGLYWIDLEHVAYSNWQANANQKIAEAAREALAITVPSDWVAEVFRRDMRLEPTIIGHGIEPEEWDPLPNRGYLLWNKTRIADVCDPSPAFELAKRGHKVVATFAPAASSLPATMTVTGSMRWEDMRDVVRAADIYLATTFETFGVGTLEAMAAGVPVLGYKWGATADLVRHEVEGCMVEPGDLEGLVRGIEYIHLHRADLSAAAKKRAAEFRWEIAMQKYADLYQRVAGGIAAQGPLGVSIVIPCHNYAGFLPSAVRSAVEQSHPPKEVIVVDDYSGDATPAVAASLQAEYPGKITYLRNDRNKGVAFSRNRGVGQATGDLIICLDADDHLDRRYIEALLPEFVKDRALGVAYTGLDIEVENGKIKSSRYPPPFSWESQSTAHVPPSNCILSGAMFRKEMWRRSGGYKQQYAPGEDAEFWTRGLACGFTAKQVTDLPLFHYRVHDRSASRTKRYVATDDHAPWMHDRHFPFAAPALQAPAVVRSYARPLVSVVIRSGRSSPRIAETLDDLLGQTFREWEVLVEGNAAAEEWAVPYPFVRWLEGRQWQEVVRGPWIWLLQAGETMVPDTLANMLSDQIETSGANGRKPLQENKNMGGCCGGQSKAVLRAKMFVQQQNYISEVDLSQALKIGGGHMRLEYVGDRIGAVTFNGNEGRTYRGGNSALHRYAEVHEDDVQKLLASGSWRAVMARPAPPVSASVQPPAPPVPEAEIKEPAAVEVVEASAVAETEVVSAVVAEVATPKPRARPGPKPGSKRKTSA